MTRVKKITAIVSAILMLGTIIYQVNAYNGDVGEPVVTVHSDVEGIDEGDAYSPENVEDSEEITLGYFEDDNVDGIVLGEFEDADGDREDGYMGIAPFITPPPYTALEFWDTTTNTFKHVQIHVPTLPTPNSQIGISIAPDVIGTFRVGDETQTVLIGDIIPENWEVLSWSVRYNISNMPPYVREYTYTSMPFGHELIHTLPDDICLDYDWWGMLPTFRANLRPIPAILSGTVTCVTCPEREEGVPGLPMPGVYIRLYDDEGDFVRLEVTDEDGFFDFGVVPFGDFELVKEVDTVPEGHLSIEPKRIELTIATPAGEYEEHFFVECKEPPTLEKEATHINGEPIEEGQMVVNGDIITYRLRVNNPNYRPWSDFLIIDELPAGLTLVGDVVVTPASALIDYGATEDVLVVWIDLPAGPGSAGNVDIVYTARVDDVTLAVNGYFVNVATLYGPRGEGGEREPVDYCDAEVPARPPSISLDKSVYPETVDPGGVVTYTLVVKNTGGTALTNVVVTDDLPAELTQPRNLVITPANAGSGSFVGQRLTVTIPRLEIGEVVTIRFDATVSADAVPGIPINNVASVTTEQNVSDQDDATVDVSVPGVFRPPGISLEKSVSSRTVQAGGNLTYTIVVRNLGDIVLTNVVVRDELPSQLTNPRNLVIAPANVGTGSFEGQLLTVTIPELGIDQVVTITFDVTVAAGVANNTVIRNVASVTTEQGPSGQDDARVTVGAPRQPGPLTGDDGILGSLMFMFVVGGTMLVMMSLIKAEKKKIRKK